MTAKGGGGGAGQEGQPYTFLKQLEVDGGKDPSGGVEVRTYRSLLISQAGESIQLVLIAMNLIG